MKKEPDWGLVLFSVISWIAVVVSRIDGASVSLMMWTALWAIAIASVGGSVLSWLRD